MNEYEPYPGPNSEQHLPDVEASEKSMRIAGFAMWAAFTSISIVGNVSEQTDAFESTALAAFGTGAALLTEKMRHDRIKPYKEAPGRTET